MPDTRKPAPYAVEMRPLERVKPYPANAKAHSEEAVAKLARLIDKLRLNGKLRLLVPIIVDPKGVILKGHRTHRAAQLLGMTEVPVHVARGLSASEAKAWRLADNRVAQDSGWDEDLLRTELGDLEAAGFDLALTGFGDEELEAMLHPGGGGLQAGVHPDDVPEPPKKATTQPGDLIHLGRHRLLCGDSTRADHWERLLGDERADLLWTDPPYGVAFSTDHLREWDGGNKRGVDAKDIANDALTPDELQAFLRGVLSLALAYTRDGGAWYVAGPASAGPAWAFTTTLYDLAVFRQMLVWAKDSFVLGRSDYHGRFEALYYGWKEGAAHYFVDDRTQDTVWEIPRPKASKEHPTMKPVELVARAIRNSSKPGDLVVDPFCGSGTTLIAAEQEGRRACLMELDPRYADVTVTRWEQATGQTAQRPKAAA